MQKDYTQMESSLNRYSINEEIANSITHGIGIILAMVALGILIAGTRITDNPKNIISVSVYGVTLILLYTTSTLYHSLQNPRTKYIFQKLDHAAIFFLIAGTYTPITLISLSGPWGWSLFAVTWCLAIIGIAIQFGQSKRWHAVSLALYIGMGWTIIVAIKPLLLSVAPGGIILLFLGGLAYTFGVLFYRWEKLKFHHAIWHVFVLAGSTLHFFAVLFYVIPIQ